ncbi:hypothetical protein CBM2633_B90296 [Cupriavidus taiwanensis]|nr:hypothetical protein CBM2633_B90296 [Cupriavidus taiwanensis]
MLFATKRHRFPHAYRLIHWFAGCIRGRETGWQSAGPKHRTNTRAQGGFDKSNWEESICRGGVGILANAASVFSSAGCSRLASPSMTGSPGPPR